MKKLLTLILVLGMASMASAAVWYEVDEADAKASYAPSDWITINLAADEVVNTLMIDAIGDGGAGGLAADPITYNSAYVNVAGAGDIVNTGNVLIEYISMAAGTAADATGILYSFEYHVPDVPDSTWIEIGGYTDGGAYYFEIPEGEPVLIHVPEPMTIGLLVLGGLGLLRRRRTA